MEKIKLEAHKSLRLVNVLTKELRGIQLEQLDEEIKKFSNFLEVSNIQTRGPLISKTTGMKISDLGVITLDYDIMIQCVREVLPQGYVFHENIMAKNCLYAHFEGLQEEFSFVSSKMALHIWENDWIETGEEYTIHLQSEEANFVVDVFKPLEETL